jgi:Ca2+:H+ antiporter
VDVTENVIKGTFLTPFSTGFIIFPIVCNFGELVTAFMFAWRGNMRDAMEVAAGSSVQMPLFVTPVVVFLSVLFAFGNPDLVLTLIFKPLELIIVALATFVYALVNLDGETTWLEGLQLLAFFAMIAVTAFALPGA